MKEAERMRRSLSDYSCFETLLDEAIVLVELGAVEEEIGSVLDNALAVLGALERTLMFNKEGDDLPVMIEIKSGAGGLESEDFALALMRMYQRWAKQSGMTVENSYLQEGSGGGVKCCVLNVFGDNAHGRLRSEVGVHRMVRVSPFDKKKRTHTSFTSVSIVPIIDDTIEVNVSPGDLEWDFFRSSGAGGQAVNKVETAVRVTHAPSGLVVTCQQARTQWANRETALKMLRSKLYDMELSKKREAVEQAHDNSDEVSFGSQIRSYVLNGNKNVKDHRTGFVSTDTSSVLDGDIDGFIRSFLLKKNSL